MLGSGSVFASRDRKVPRGVSRIIFYPRQMIEVAIGRVGMVSCSREISGYANNRPNYEPHVASFL